MEKKKTGIVKWSVLSVVTAALMIASIVGTTIAMDYQKVINIYLGTSNFKVVTDGENGDVVNYESAYGSSEELLDAGHKMGAMLEKEGAVLLKNNGALPLSSNAKVSCFSHSSVDIVYGGTGSAAFDESEAMNLKAAFENAGLDVNDTLWDFYETGAGSSYERTVASWDDPEATYSANEVPWSVYTDDVKASFAQYGDSAIVVLSRVGGEDNDLIVIDPVTGENVNYLELSAEEQELLKQLKALKDAGVFKNTIVLLNTANALEVDFLFDDAYGVDAALWIGDVGMTGMNGVASVLTGESNPSGRLVDTYCIDNTTSPVMMNFGDVYFTNAEEKNLYMDEDWREYGAVVYQEGIYVGYRYYETRYEDTVMGTGNTEGYDYASDVAYPFGYGLSYTTFEYSDFSVVENEDSFDVFVTVTNTGDVAGKEVVQIYFQSPYTDYDKENKIEKAAIELCGFDKTEILEPGKSETVTINVPKDEFKAYDAENAKTYILDAGDYYLTAGKDAHDALNNVLAAKGYSVADGMDDAGNNELTFKWTNDKLDTTTYAVSEATGYEITNQFEDADINKSELTDATVTYLTRSDWAGTFPKETYQFEATDAMIAEMQKSKGNLTSESEGEMPTMGADNGLVLANFIGVDYDDPSWEALLDQLTFEEMRNLVGIAYHATNAVESVSKPETKEENGPQGLTALLTHGASAMAYTSEDVMAATWNRELIKDVGELIGEDCLNTGYSGLYGPGANMHRTPYAGRNFEYYSEDSFLAGEICAAEVIGIQSKGVYVYLKHFALNDQESMRCGVSTWSNEQAIREIYLVPFEKAIVDADAHCVMSAYNCIGTTWAGSHYGLMTEILRNEFGMDGIAITDWGGMMYMDTKLGLLAGSNCWDYSGVEQADKIALYEDEAQVVRALRESAHRMLYTVANSNAMNGMSASTKIVSVMPWWQTALYVLDVVTVVLFATSAIILVRKIMKVKTVKN